MFGTTSEQQRRQQQFGVGRMRKAAAGLTGGVACALAQLSSTPLAGADVAVPEIPDQPVAAPAAPHENDKPASNRGELPSVDPQRPSTAVPAELEPGAQGQPSNASGQSALAAPAPMPLPDPPVIPSVPAVAPGPLLDFADGAVDAADAYVGTATNALPQLRGLLAVTRAAFGIDTDHVATDVAVHDDLAVEASSSVKLEALGPGASDDRAVTVSAEPLWEAANVVRNFLDPAASGDAPIANLDQALAAFGVVAPPPAEVAPPRVEVGPAFVDGAFQVHR